MKHLSRICLSLALIICCLIGIAVNAQAATTVDSGKCGTNLTWKLDSEGTLTISGTGDMKNFGWNSEGTQYSYAPWYDVCSSVKEVVIKSGVTSIGENAFYNHYNLTSVTIPKTVTKIGRSAFEHDHMLRRNLSRGLSAKNYSYCT